MHMCLQVYKEARNYMLNKYREDVSRRLSFTEVRAGLAGDVGGLQRIYSFLDHWGLINYQAGDGVQQAASDATPFAVAPASELPQRDHCQCNLLHCQIQYASDFCCW